MQAAGIHVGDVGTLLRCLFVAPDPDDPDQEATLPFDISQASAKELILEKPTTPATSITRAGVFETTGADGVLCYSTVSGDINVAGYWYAQGRVTFPDGSIFHSNRVKFRVWPNNA